MDRKGTYTVEFAIVLPIILLMAFASIEFARVSNVRYALHSASYEAARVVVVPGATADEAEARANEILRRHGLRLTDITVNPATIDESTSEVTVSIDAEMRNNAWSLINFTGDTTLSSDTTLLTERAPSVLLDAIPELPPPPPAPVDPTQNPGDDGDDGGNDSDADNGGGGEPSPAPPAPRPSPPRPRTPPPPRPFL